MACLLCYPSPCHSLSQEQWSFSEECIVDTTVLLFTQWVLDTRNHVPVVSVSTPVTLSSSEHLASAEWVAVVWFVGEMAHCCTAHISGTEFQFHSVWQRAQLGSSTSQLSTRHREARRQTYSQRDCTGSVTGNFLESCVWEPSQEGAAADSPAVCLEWELHVGPRQSFWVMIHWEDGSHSVRQTNQLDKQLAPWGKCKAAVTASVSVPHIIYVRNKLPWLNYCWFVFLCCMCYRQLAFF